MRVLLQRLVAPVVLLIAFIGVGIALDRFGYDELPEAGANITTTPADTPVFSIRRAPELLTSPRAAEELNESLEAWVAGLPRESCFVVSAGAERIFEHQSGLPLTPASNMKILTAIAALETLGPDYQFETVVAATSRPDANGLLLGDLFVVGGGDPVLMTDAYLATLPENASQIRSSAETLADQTIATNIADVQGAVVVIEDRYDTERAPAAVPQFALDSALIGSLSAAMLDRGFTGLSEQYASQTEDPLLPFVRSATPAQQFAANFDDLLEARNVIIAARPRVDLEPPTAPLISLLTFKSPPLSDIVTQMLTNSDNTTAEMLIKELGFLAPTTTTGSTTSGLLNLTSQLTNLGLNAGDVFAFDGSGLNADTKVTCDLLHQALSAPAHKDDLRAALPVAGETGTLADAFSDTRGAGNLRAKTGSLAQATALSGYFTTDPGVEVTFSLIINVSGQDEVITPGQITEWTRPIPRLLAPYPAGPPLSELGPIGLVVEASLDLDSENDPDGNEGPDNNGDAQVDGQAEADDG